MKNTSVTRSWHRYRRSFLLLGYGVLTAAAGGATMYFAGPLLSPRSVPAASAETAGEGIGPEEEKFSDVVLPKAKWAIAGIRVEPARKGSLTETAWVTGKLTLNEDRVAHIFSLVEGRVDLVDVQFGDDVKKGDLLAIVDSKEVGEAKLALYKARLAAKFAKTTHDWNKEINTNTQELITTLEKRTPITEIDALFGDKPMGEYRQQLLSAYANLHKSHADLLRLEPLSKQGVTAGKQVLAAQATYEADQATFLALLEQLKFTVWQKSLMAEQQLQVAEQAVAVSQSRLFILGYKESELRGIDPDKEGEAISHFALKAPFDGTVIAKNVAFGERVGTDSEMMQVANLSTMWVQADIYQKDLPLVAELGKTLRFRSQSYSHVHEAAVFYTGDVLDPETRTMRLRAVVDNADRHLKPGMFVEIQLPGRTIDDVITVPISAVQRHQDVAFVFVRKQGETFQRRDVKTGASSGGEIEIIDGLEVGDRVVVEGGFALKSEMLKDLMTEDD